jgi:hypothetical protein
VSFDPGAWRDLMRNTHALQEANAALVAETRKVWLSTRQLRQRRALKRGATLQDLIASEVEDVRVRENRCGWCGVSGCEEHADLEGLYLGES